MPNARKPIPSLRWWIGLLLFASTVINYHRPPDAFPPRSLSQSSISLDEFRLCESRDRVSAGVFHWADGVRQAHGSLWHAARSDHDRDLVFGDLDARPRWLPVSTVLRRFVFCWARANRPTGPPRRKPSRSGFRSASARWRPRSSIAGRRLAERSLLLLCWGFTFAGDGVPRSWCRACLGFLWLIFWRWLYLLRQRSTAASARKNAR